MYNGKNIKIGIVGISGKLGKAIVQEAQKWTNIEIIVGVIRKDKPNYAKLVEEINENSVNEITITSQVNCLEQCDVIVDCSRKEVCLENLSEYRMLNKPIVIAVTGFNKAEMDKIKNSLDSMPVIISGNFSRSFFVFCKGIQNMVKAINHTMDICIIEYHHKEKRDKPSGTALKIREQIVKSDTRYNDLDIPISSIRIGKIFGRHEVVFANDNGETITVIHEIDTRSCFAEGIFEAILWLCKERENKIYTDFEWLDN